MAARLPIPGKDKDVWGGILNTFLRVTHNPDGTLRTSAVTKAGAYIKPQGGIPTSDLAGGIPQSLLTVATQTAIASVASKYVKPPSGIPTNDLSSTVQNALSAATTALQPDTAIHGDLQGTISSPTVTKINGIALPTSAPTGVGQVLTSTSTSASAWSTPNSIDGVTVSGTPSSGQVLQASSSTAASWQTLGNDTDTLAGDTDVTITSPSNNQVLAYNSTTSKWVNQTPTSGVQLDTTASDIQTDTTTGSPVAGNTGKAADAGHQHPLVAHDHTTATKGGQIPIGGLSATGTASSSTFLRGDNTWSALPTAGTSTPGLIQLTGDLGGSATSPQVTSTHLVSALPVNQGGTGSTTQNFVDLSTNQSIGGIKTFTGEVIVPAPVNGTDAATKSYVDSTAQGLDPKQSVAATTTAALPSNTYNNGSSGVGATLTATSNGALTVDGYTVQANDRLLVKNEVAGANNGIYQVTSTGSVSSPYVLTRTNDFNTSAEVPGAYAFAEQGSTNAGSGFVCTTTGTITFGTTAITWIQFSGAGEVTAGTGLTKSGNTLSLSVPVTINQGGTGQTTQQAALNALAGAQSNGKYLRSDGTNTTLSAIQSGDLPAATSSLQGAIQLTGDLGGSATSPAVARINGITLPASAPTGSGQILTSTSTSATAWQAPASAPVTSVFGRTGVVVAQSGDYTAAQVGALPSNDDLSAIATANVTAGNVSLNTHKITNLANGTAPTDAAAFGQIPTSASSIGGLLAANNLSDVSNAATARGNLSAAQALVPTAIKTGAYTANPGDFVPVDASSGSVTITLPTAPADKSRIEVKMINTSGSNTVTIQAGGTDVFNKAGGSTSATLSLLNQALMLQYTTSSGIWYVQSDDLPLSQLDTRYTKTGSLFYNVKDYGATGNGTTDDTSSIQAAWTALTTAGSGTLFFPTGTYLTTGLVLQSASNFTLLGGKGSVIWIAASTTGSPLQVSRNILTIADCTDFAVTGLTIDGRRDTIAPLNLLATNASASQASVQIGNGLAASYVVGQQLDVLGGLTANSGNDANKQDTHMTIQSITPGVGGGNDTITFTTNLANAYTAQASSTISDAYGPYAANGAYITPWQTGQNYTVAGRTLSEEDQQNGIHLIHCSRFDINHNTIRNMWESSIRMGTHLLNGTSQNDGCSYGTIANNILYHGYDQGVGAWVSHDITITGNIISSAGWAAICFTMGYDSTITGNVCDDSVQRIPNDTKDGNGIALEGAYRTVVSNNLIRNATAEGIHLTAAGTLPFGSPAQVATTIASGSNNTALPTATINVASTTGFATAGTITVLSSAGPQLIIYTGTTGTSFTGCNTGASSGVGTLFTGQRIVQYPLFINNSGLAVTPGATTLTVTDGTKFQVNGHYSITDNAKTERITVTAIAGNVITLAEPTTYDHNDQTQIGQAVAEGNVLSGNSIIACGDFGIQLASAVRTTITGNTIDRAGTSGIAGIVWTSGGLQAPFGTMVTGNTITTPGASGSGAYYQAIAFQQVNDVVITGNRCSGADSITGYFYAIGLVSCANCTIANNTVADTYAIGIRLDTLTDWPCKEVSVVNNNVRGTGGEGIILYGGDSLYVSGNIIRNCAANHGPAGFGGALDIRGVTNSQISHNVVVNNGHNGIGLDNATINGSTVICSGNTLAGNISRDDGKNYDPFTGVSTKQNSGISELSTGQGPNIYLNNIVSGCTTNWHITSTGNTLRGNQNYNPVGLFSSQPGVPASGTPYTNTLNADGTAYITGGTVTGIAVGGSATGMTSGNFRVPAGQTITLTYSAAPTWTWFGD